MFTKQDVIEIITQEHEIIKHLASKVTTQEHLDYRPSEEQRSVQELLEYMSRMTTSFVTTLQAKEMNPDASKQQREESESKNMLTDFNNSMDAQLSKVVEYISNVSEAELEETFDLFKMGNPASLKSYLMIILRQYPAYRMQLFLYLKSGLGMAELNTMNVWMGFDAPKK